MYTEQWLHTAVEQNRESQAEPPGQCKAPGKGRGRMTKSSVMRIVSNAQCLDK